jgi:hypothetical protein
MMPERANRRNPAPVRRRQARTAFARPNSATCSVAVRSASGLSPPKVCASVRAGGRYRRNAASSRSASTCGDRPAQDHVQHIPQAFRRNGISGMGVHRSPGAESARHSTSLTSRHGER